MARPGQIGLDNLVWFPMNNIDTELYGAPLAIPEIKSATINPRTSTTSAYADDMQTDEIESLDGIDFTVENNGLSTDILKAWFGHTIDAKGVLSKGKTDIAGFGALAFRSLRRDGKYQYQLLTKCKAKLGADNYKTKGEKAEVQTKTVTFSCMPRKKDGKWQLQATDGDANLGPDVIANWFTKPYGEA